MDIIEANTLYWEGPDGMLDLCAGLALLTGHRRRSFAKAMDTRDSDAAEHLTAVAIVILVAHENVECWMSERWVSLYRLRRTMLAMQDEMPEVNR